MVDSPSGKIFNPETKRCVNIDGKIGMELAAKQNKRKHASAGSKSVSIKPTRVSKSSHSSLAKSKSTRSSPTKSISTRSLTTKSSHYFLAKSKSTRSSPTKFKSSHSSIAKSKSSRSSPAKSKSTRSIKDEMTKMLQNPKIMNQMVNILSLFERAESDRGGSSYVQFDSSIKGMTMSYVPGRGDYPFTVSFYVEYADGKSSDASYPLKYTQIWPIHIAICQGNIMDVVDMDEFQKSELTTKYMTNIQKVANDMMKGNINLYYQAF